MRSSLVIMFAIGLSAVALAHHPDRENKPVWPYIDVIPPLGKNLPMSYRRRYNRPRNIGGKVAYWIAPSSQEAMAWHRATHLGYYEEKAPRMVTHYFYPKPWEILPIGARPIGTEQNDQNRDSNPTEEMTPYGPVGELPEVDVLELLPGKSPRDGMINE